MLETGALAVPAIAMGDVHAHQSDHDFQHFLRPNQHPEVAGKSFVAGRTAQFHAKVNARLDLATFKSDLDSFDTDVIGIFDRTNQSAAVKGDVELAWQIIKRAVVDNDLRELLTEWTDIDQF